MRPFLTKIAAEPNPKKLKIWTSSGPDSTKRSLIICNIFFHKSSCHKHKKLPIKFFARVNRSRVKIFFGKLHPTGGYIFTPPSKKNPDVNFQNADTRICFFGPLNQTPLSEPYNFFLCCTV